MKRIGTLAFLSIFCLPVLGQKNVTKVNLSSFAFTNISTQYERAFGKYFSTCAGIGIMPSRKMPGLIAPEGTNIGPPRFSGNFITPEFRIYPGGEKPAPSGFYFSFYGRRTQYKLTMDYYYTRDNGSTDIYDATFKYVGAGAGMGIGTQFIMGKHFSLDLYIIGVHFGTGKVKGAIESDAINSFTPEEKAELEAEIKADYGSAMIKYENGEAGLTIPGLPFFGMRGLGVNLGFAF